MVTDSARSPLRSVVPPRVVVPLLVALLHLLQGVRRILGRGVGAQPVRAAAAAVPALDGVVVEAEVELLVLAHRATFLVRQPSPGGSGHSPVTPSMRSRSRSA